MFATQAIVVDPDVGGRLAIRTVERPMPALSEALVRVHATSLNVGDIYKIPLADAGWRPGWDLAGIVEQAAADGSGPAKGARVVGGLLSSRAGTWAELVAVPTKWLAEIPVEVSFAQAATLPTAGLTALYALEKSGFLLNRNVLVTGASGSVGHFACQLARRAGAYVTGMVRRPERADSVRATGAHHVVVGEDLAAAEPSGPYHLIIDTLGGTALATALTLLVPDGLCVNLGIMQNPEIPLNLATIFGQTGGINLCALILFTELEHRAATEDLRRLACMVAERRLHPLIGIEAPWTEVAEVVRQFQERRFAGKAILHISQG